MKQINEIEYSRIVKTYGNRLELVKYSFDEIEEKFYAVRGSDDIVLKIVKIKEEKIYYVEYKFYLNFTTRSKY